MIKDITGRVSPHAHRQTCRADNIGTPLDHRDSLHRLPDCCAVAASGLSQVLLAAAPAAATAAAPAPTPAPATYHRCCAPLLLILSQLPSWSRLACDMFRC